MQHFTEMVASRYWCQKLEEIGFPQSQCLLAWIKPNGRRKKGSVTRNQFGQGWAAVDTRTLNVGTEKCLGAPTAVEIMDRLPMIHITCISDGHSYCMTYDEPKGWWRGPKSHDEIHKTLADAAAATYYYINSK